MLQEIAFLVSKQILNKKHTVKKRIGSHLIRPWFLFLYSFQIMPMSYLTTKKHFITGDNTHSHCLQIYSTTICK